MRLEAMIFRILCAKKLRRSVQAPVSYRRNLVDILFRHIGTVGLYLPKYGSSVLLYWMKIFVTIFSKKKSFLIVHQFHIWRN